jgi:hypothetical protein
MNQISTTKHFKTAILLISYPTITHQEFWGFLKQHEMADYKGQEAREHLTPHLEQLQFVE